MKARTLREWIEFVGDVSASEALNCSEGWAYQVRVGRRAPSLGLIARGREVWGKGFDAVGSAADAMAVKLGHAENPTAAASDTDATPTADVAGARDA